MTLLKKYLIGRLSFVAVLICFTVLFAVSFALYRLPLGAVLYPAVLCLLIGAAVFAFGFIRSLRRHRELERLKSSVSLLPDELPPARGVEEDDYRDICLRLRELLREHERRSSADAEAMKDYYTVWAHQIKTPIASMRLRLQNEDSELSRSMLSGLGRIEQYVEMVLTYIRLEGGSDYVIREYDLDGILRPTLRKFAGDFIGRRLKLDYTPVSATVLTDSKWLSFVVGQLISNALKYTRSGSVSVYLEEPATLCVRDTGIGIAPEDLPRVFEMSYTGAAGRADMRSSGIGLYLCRRICRNLGHSIGIESVPGEGTLVRVGLGADRPLAE
ncbi:MAG: sensor histidine kinase [Oscillospiraceae bacterium]|jgi:signal transduction histidine kinase|nr:sensor histidine kinase [Oscillospiraceae bacterium]